MADSVEEFAQQLKQRIAEQAHGRMGYVYSADLIGAIDQAMQGQDAASANYPRWLYREDQQCLVATREEEEAAIGWSRVPPAQEYEPLWMTERQQYDRRSVLLRSAAEEQTFRANTEEVDWIKDNGRSWGGRGIALSEIIEERKTLLHKMLDADLAAEPAAAAPPDATDPAQTTHIGSAVAAPAEEDEQDEETR